MKVNVVKQINRIFNIFLVTMITVAFLFITGTQEIDAVGSSITTEGIGIFLRKVDMYGNFISGEMFQYKDTCETTEDGETVYKPCHIYFPYYLTKVRLPIPTKVN